VDGGDGASANVHAVRSHGGVGGNTQTRSNSAHVLNVTLLLQKHLPHFELSLEETTFGRKKFQQCCADQGKQAQRQASTNILNQSQQYFALSNSRNWFKMLVAAWR
jgi:hypothetical protein